MKKYILLNAIRNLRAKPALLRKVKILALVGVASFVLIGGLLIWAAVAAFNSFSAKAVTFAQTNRISEIQTISCWNQAQSLMNSTSLLQKPLADSWSELKNACFKQNPATQEGSST